MQYKFLDFFNADIFLECMIEILNIFFFYYYFAKYTKIIKIHFCSNINQRVENIQKNSVKLTFSSSSCLKIKIRILLLYAVCFLLYLFFIWVVFNEYLISSWIFYELLIFLWYLLIFNVIMCKLKFYIWNFFFNYCQIFFINFGFHLSF